MIEHRLPTGQGLTLGGGFGGYHPGRFGRQVVAGLGIDRIEHLAHRQQGLGGLLGFLVGGGRFECFDGAQQRLGHSPLPAKRWGRWIGACAKTEGAAQTLLLVATKRLSLFRRGDGSVCLFHRDKHGTGITSGD